MSHRQFGFLAGLLIAWLWATTGFLVALGGVAAGLVGYVVVRVLSGDIRLGDLTDRFGSKRT
ncbi:MAG TPA: hypothetical protein VGN37_09485 [Actinocatenispora sp.]